MAKRGPKPKVQAGPGDTRQTVISIKGTPEFRDWLNRLAEFERITAVQSIEKALVLYAKHIGFAEEAPKRTVR